MDDWQQFFGDGADTAIARYFGGEEHAGRHFIREHAAEAVEAGALIRWRGAWYAHRVEFPKFALSVAQRMARRAVERARASAVA